MARLDSQIQALINYANETTGKEDTQLGDAVKSLADGYKGGGTDYPLPTITDADALSSKLTALIAYANGITGKADATIGDAVRSLVEGYGGGGRLPSEYQEVEYIESTGTQYIDTRIYGDIADKLSVELEYMSLSSRQEHSLLGLLQSRSPYVYQIVYRYNEGTDVHLGNYDVLIPQADNSWVSLIFNNDNGILTHNNTDYNVGLSHSIPRDAGTFVLFAYRINGTVKNFGYYRLKKANFRVDGDTVFAPIPCYRKSDNKPGLYNLVSGEFLTNQGTGEFIVGPDVN